MHDQVAYHQSVYATPGLPKFEYSQVADRLYAGRNPLTALDVAELASLGITHTLDLREPHEWQAPRFGDEALQEISRRGITRHHLPVVDAGVPTPEQLERAVIFLRGALREPTFKVYVHCRAGIERTSAVLVAYWGRTWGMTYDQALHALRKGRPSLRRHGEAEVAQWLASGQ